MAHSTVLSLTQQNQKSLLFSSFFVCANAIVPLILHQISPGAGQIFLPVYLFTLIAGLSFGWKSGLVVGLLSPLLSYALSHMPILSILPFVIFKSVLLGFLAGYLQKFSKKWIFLTATLAVLFTQFGGASVIFLLTQNVRFATSDMNIGYPGILLQVILAPLVAMYTRQYLKLKHEEL